MRLLSNLPAAGGIVIVAILALFVLAVIALFAVYGRYQGLIRQITRREEDGEGFVGFVRADYASAYREYGQNTNTPAIINSAMAARLNGSLLCERFMNSAVSMFVTLGLFGTFLGLSLSVSSLTDLISLSSSEEWLSILDSVGGGLVSALSGMGVAFYTSLVGVACSILFTILRTICNPQAQREKLETITELWLDHVVAPTLETQYTADDESRMVQLKEELRAHARSVQKSLSACTDNMERVLQQTTESLGKMIEYSKEPIGVFYDTVNTFNQNVRDFSEFNYDLRGNIERMDLCFRELSGTLRQANQTISSGGKQA